MLNCRRMPLSASPSCRCPGCAVIFPIFITAWRTAVPALAGVFLGGAACNSSITGTAALHRAKALLLSLDLGESLTFTTASALETEMSYLASSLDTDDLRSASWANSRC